jgi:hypothetical protein
MNFVLRVEVPMGVYENLRDILKWITFYVLVFVGSYVAIRIPLFRIFRIPEGLRLVLGIEAVGLLIATSIHILSGFPGLRAARREMLVRAAQLFGSGAEPQASPSSEGT